MIDYYFKLIEKRGQQSRLLPSVLALSKFFYDVLKGERDYETLKKYSNNGNLSSFDLVLIPILDRKHWSLCVSIKKIQTYTTLT